MKKLSIIICLYFLLSGCCKLCEMQMATEWRVSGGNNEVSISKERGGESGFRAHAKTGIADGEFDRTVLQTNKKEETK